MELQPSRDYDLQKILSQSVGLDTMREEASLWLSKEEHVRFVAVRFAFELHVRFVEAN